MKKLFVIFFMIFSVLSFSQKVKFKKEKVLIDDVETFSFEDEGNMTSYSTLEGEEFLSVLKTSYEERNPNYYSAPNPSKYGIKPTLTKFVYTVKFIKYDKELTTDMSNKDLFKAIYKYTLVDSEGNIDEEKLNTFISKYNNENLRFKIN